MRRPPGVTETGRFEMQDESQAATMNAHVSRRQTIMGLAALLAAGSGLTALRSAAARENEPGDDHGGHGNDDHGHRHGRHRRRGHRHN